MKPLVSLLFFLVAVGGGALCGYCVKPLSAEQWEAYNALLRGDITEEPSVQSSTWTQAVTLLTNRDPVVAITAVRSLCRLDASKAIAVLVTNM